MKTIIFKTDDYDSTDFDSLLDEIQAAIDNGTQEDHKDIDLDGVVMAMLETDEDQIYQVDDSDNLVTCGDCDTCNDTINCEEYTNSWREDPFYLAKCEAEANL